MDFSTDAQKMPVYLSFTSKQIESEMGKSNNNILLSINPNS